MFEISGMGKPLINRSQITTPTIPKTRYKTKSSLPPIKTQNHSKLQNKINKSNTLSTKSIKSIGRNKSKPKISPKKAISLYEEAENLLRTPADHSNGGCGTVRVRFNHYSKEFPVHNGVLRWEDVDNEYCISFVYRGDYVRDLYKEEAISDSPGIQGKVSAVSATRDPAGVYFLRLTAGNQYRLTLQEDPQAGIGAEGLRITKGPLVLSKSHSGDVKSGNAAVVEITKSLLQMNASDLHTEEAKLLREQRDIEDVLFS